MDRCTVAALLGLVAFGCEGGEEGWEGEPAPAEAGTAIGPAVVEVIGPDGGDLRSADGGFTLTVPAGALPDDTELTLLPITNTAWGGLGDGYRVSPVVAFDRPVQVTLAYSEQDLVGTSEEALGVAAQDPDGYWIAFADGVVDPEAGTVTVETEDLGSPVPLGRGTGAVDFAKHWRIALEPAESTVKLGGTKALQLVACTTTETIGWPFDSGTALGPPAPYAHNGPVTWEVRGSPAGTVKGGQATATYTAPSTERAKGRTNFVVAELSIGSTRLAPKATIQIEDEPDSWVGTSQFNTADVVYVADLTWIYDSTHGTERWYVPTGRIDVTHFENGSCDTTPLTYEVVDTDGLLVVDTATEPASYSGQGVTVWVTETDCPEAPTINLPFPAVFFGDGEGSVTTLGAVRVVGDGEVIEDSRLIGDATLSWHFERR